MIREDATCVPKPMADYLRRSVSILLEEKEALRMENEALKKMLVDSTALHLATIERLKRSEAILVKRNVELCMKIDPPVKDGGQALKRIKPAPIKIEKQGKSNDENIIKNDG
jgi:hypothetical protein